MLLAGALFELIIHQNAYAAGALPWTPLEKLTELPDPSWFSGSRFAAGGGRKGEGREGRRKIEGIAFPDFFFYNLTTAQQ